VAARRGRGPIGHDAFGTADSEAADRRVQSRRPKREEGRIACGAPRRQQPG